MDDTTVRSHVCRSFGWVGLLSALIWVGILWGEPGGAQTFFTEITEEAMRGPLFRSRSAAFGDYDNDGWPDVFLAENWGSGIALLHNEGHRRLTNRTAGMQVEISPKEKGGGAIFGDYDNDGDVDLFVPVGMWRSTGHALNMLLRNDRGVFRDVTLEAGLTDELPTDNAIWLDYNRDGYYRPLYGESGRSRGAQQALSEQRGWDLYGRDP